jgi:hypothetical protein
LYELEHVRRLSRAPPPSPASVALHAMVTAASTSSLPDTFQTTQLWQKISTAVAVQPNFEIVDVSDIHNMTQHVHCKISAKIVPGPGFTSKQSLPDWQVEGCHARSNGRQQNELLLRRQSCRVDILYISPVRHTVQTLLDVGGT